MDVPSWVGYLAAGVGAYVAIGVICLCMKPLRRPLMMDLVIHHIRQSLRGANPVPAYKEILLVVILFGLAWPVVVLKYISYWWEIVQFVNKTEGFPLWYAVMPHWLALKVQTTRWWPGIMERAWARRVPYGQAAEARKDQ